MQADTPIIHGIEDRPPLGERAVLGAQHLVAMLLGNITPPLLIAGALGLDHGTTAVLMQAALVMAGVATLVQAYPIGPVGGRLPIVMGTSIAFVGGFVIIGKEHGIAAAFGACLGAAWVEVALGFAIQPLRRLFPPLVNAIVVMLIGLTLMPVGVDYAAGGKGAADYGALHHLGLAALVFGVTLVLHQRGRGVWRHASMLVGVLAGYGAALAMGRVDLSPVAEASWASLPRPLALGLTFKWEAIALMAVLYVISAMETLGDVAGTTAAAGREPTGEELRGGLVADGVMSGLAALLSAPPNTSYSQNVGLVNFTGILSRHVTAASGVFLLLLGLVPKVAALFATLPKAVIGGGGLIMFSMIFASGVGILQQSVRLDRRAMVILAVSVGLGLGVELRPAALGALPEGLQTFLGTGLVTGGLVALSLNLLMPEERPSA